MAAMIELAGVSPEGEIIGRISTHRAGPFTEELRYFAFCDWSDSEELFSIEDAKNWVWLKSGRTDIIWIDLLTYEETVEAAVTSLSDPESCTEQELRELEEELEERVPELEGLRFDISTLADGIAQTPDLDRVIDIAERGRLPMGVKEAEEQIGEFDGLDITNPNHGPELDEEDFAELMDRREGDVELMLAEAGFTEIEATLREGSDRIYITRRGWRWYRVDVCNRYEHWVARPLAF